MILAVRGRLILSEDRPPIRGFDQDLWAERFRYDEAPIQIALAQLRGLRGAESGALARASGPPTSRAR